MSKGIGITTVLGCLAAGEPLMNVTPSGWWGLDTAHEDQKHFLAHQLGWRGSLDKFGEVLRSFAHFDYSQVRAKAGEWNMRIEIPSNLPAGGVYMISQYKEKIDWLFTGERVDYLFSYPTFWLRDGLGFFMHRYSMEPVVSIATKTGDVVYVTRWSEPLSGLGILRQIEKIEENLVPSSRNYDGVQIPCISSDMDVDMSWILGIKNKDWFVAWAKQKILFGMNEKGFAVREETGMYTMKGISFDQPDPYVVSPKGESFLFWRRRPGVEFPLSIYQFTSEDFKDPGDLDKIVS